MSRTKRASLCTILFQTDLGRENAASYYRQGMTFIAMVTRWSRYMFNFNALFRQNLKGQLMREIYAASGNLFTDSWSWYNIVPSSSDVFNRFFFSGCKKRNTAVIKIPLLFMTGLFIGFLVQKCAACQIHRKSNLGCYRFRFSHCLMRKRV